MTWRDRLRRAPAAAPTGPAAPGQWIYEGDEPAQVRDALAHQGDLLLPDAEGRFGGWPGAPTADRRLVLDDELRRRLEAVAGRVRALEGASWPAWEACPPIEVIGQVEDLDEHELERVLSRRLGALEAVCRRPRTSLTVEEERLLVARCRRASPRAPQVLARRSEDWSRRTVFGVEPKRVLGYVRDELFDLYENRLALHLVDRLDAWLAARVRALRLVCDAAELAHQLDDLAQGPSWRRARRIYELWGGAYDASDLLRRAREALARVRALHRRVLALRDSELARRLPAPRARALHLRLTNILANDRDYRRVVELWQAWERTGAAGSAPSAQFLWDAAQKTAGAHEDFVRLIVVRALKELGFRPAEDSPAASPTAQTSRLEGPWCALDVDLARLELTVQAPFDGAPSKLRILPLPAPVEQSGVAARWLDALPSDPGLLVVTLPGLDGDARAYPRRFRQLGNEGDGPGTMLTVAAPWDLESVERVGRALRWFVATNVLRDYPWPLKPPQGWETPAIADGDTVRGLNHDAAHRLRCSPSSRGSSFRWRALEERIAQGRSRVSELEARVARAQGGQAKQVRPELARAQRALEQDAGVLADLEARFSWFVRLRTCPVCQGSQSDWAGGEAEFRATCQEPSCRATWGLERCDRVHRYPILDLGDASTGQDPDRTWGADVLALRQGAGHRCPECPPPQSVASSGPS